jgi:hypothetical protein
MKKIITFILLIGMMASCTSQRTLTGKQQVKKDQKAYMFKGYGR